MAASEPVFGIYNKYFAVFGAIAGLYIVLKFLWSMWSGIKAFFIGKYLGLSLNLKEQGQWAVVTGATDGIGKAYAQQLAAKGLDVILVSRNPQKLRDVASEIETEHAIKTKCIAIDFTGGREIYDKLEKEIGSLDIGVLVNNVGMSVEHPEFFGDLDLEATRNIVHVNCNSVVEVTRIVLKGMVERRRGVIINIASASGNILSPLLTVYSASKAFAIFLSEGLHLEYASKGITVQCVAPYFVTTKLSKMRRANFFVPDPTTYVRAALATVGIQRKTFGCFSHALQHYLSSLLPRSVYHGFLLKAMKGARAAGIKKKEKQQKGD